MTPNYLSDNSFQRWLELVPAAFLARTLLLLGLGIATLGLVAWHLFTSVPGLVVWPALLFVLCLLLANSYLIVIYPVRESYRHPARTQHPWLVLLVVACYGILVGYIPYVVAQGANPYVALFTLTLPACSAAGLRWPAALGIIALANTALLAWLPDVIAGAYLGVLLFAQLILFLLFRLVIDEFHKRSLALWSLAELSATQRLLKDRVERDTRLAIARDLHDELGHHVTLLQVKIQQAALQHPQQVHVWHDLQQHVAQVSQQIRRITLSWRESGLVDIRSALEIMVSQVSYPQIQMNFAGFNGECGFAVGEALFRACQEAVTNSLRHANASALTIDLQQTADSITLHVLDNGQVRASVCLGSGLQGIRERVLRLRGTFNAGFTAQGFQLRIALPLNAHGDHPTQQPQACA